jgi:hypothetical protein
VKQQHCRWAEKRFAQLPDDLQAHFLETELQMAIITEATRDEVRDLFIRLQDGTPLTTQQKRDAWPGAIAPYIESLAGKMTTRGQFDRLFAAVDQRGSGAGVSADDEREAIDPYSNVRQVCAQLLLLFLHVDTGKRDLPALNSQALDRLYHEQTTLDTPRRARFELLLRACQSVVVDRRPAQARSRRNRTVVRKNRLFSYCCSSAKRRPHCQPNSRWTTSNHAVAQHFWTVPSDEVEPEPPGSRVSASSTIAAHYKWFVDVAMAGFCLPNLDAQRLFSDAQKAEILAAAHGACACCQAPLGAEAVEYDHVIPHRLGGKTIVPNWRAVHARCHPRGLAALEQVP